MTTTIEVNEKEYMDLVADNVLMAARITELESHVIDTTLKLSKILNELLLQCTK